MPALRLHIGYDGIDSSQWQARHAAGLVPNALPYGFNLLADQGFELVIHERAQSWLVRKVLGGAVRRATGGFDFVEAMRGRRRRSCDIAVHWTELLGIPAAARSRLAGEPPVVMGSVWMTDPTTKYHYGSRQIITRSVRRAAGIWANTNEQLDSLMRMGADSARLHLLHNPGIDAEFWFADRVQSDPGFVLSVGNDRHRDHPFLVRAMDRLKTKVPTATFTLVTRRPVAVPPHVGAKLDHVPHWQLRSLYGSASVVALATKPNIHVSGSTTILEAMACERPVVATYHPGYDGYITHGETGLLVPPGDEDAFAEAVRTLLRDPESARAMGRAGRKAVEEKFSSARFMTQLGEILRACAR